MPVRIQLKRKKGWKKPPDAVTVSRPSRWGNPFLVVKHDEFWMVVVERPVYRVYLTTVFEDSARDWAVRVYKRYVENILKEKPDWLTPLVGKDLCCWCEPDSPCHADVLLELANQADAADYKPEER